MSTQVAAGLEELSESDKIVKHLVRTMRDGSGMSVEAAARELVDDLGLRPLQGDEPLDLYEVVRQRYERGSIIISSNRAIDEWGALFKDNLLASAAVDRLLHHAHVVVMEGDTYRNPPASRRSQAGVSGKQVSA